MTTDPYGRFALFIEPFVQGHTGYIGLMCAKRVNVSEDNPKGQLTGIENYYLEVTNGDVQMIPGLFDDESEYEWFFTPAILKTKSRTQNQYRTSNMIWTDLDGSLDLENLSVAPTLVIQSSADRYQLYWRKEEAIRSVADQVYWNDRLMHSLNSPDIDTSGSDATQLLRLPVGRNFKWYPQTKGVPFTPFVWKSVSRAYGEVDFESLPEPPPKRIVEPDEDLLGNIPVLDRTWTEYLVEFGGRMPDALKVKLLSTQESADSKRSGGMWSLYHELKVCLNRVEIFQVLRGSPNDKWKDEANGAGKLWRDIVRSLDKIDPTNGAQAYAADIREIMNGPETLTEKRQRVSNYVMSKLADTGKFMQTDTGVLYYVDTRSDIPKLYEINDRLVSDFASYINRRFGIDPGLEKHLLQSVLLRAMYESKDAPKTDFHHMAFYDAQNNRLFIDRFDGTVYVLDGESVATEPQGYQNVWFYRDGSESYPMTFEYKEGTPRGGLDALLFSGPNYLPVSDVRLSTSLYMHCLRTWVCTLFFPQIMPTKAMAVFIGEADSGKSTFFQGLSLMLTGRETRHVQDIPSDPREFNVIVASTPWTCFDNVEVNHRWAQEKLAQVATGYIAKTRELYSNRGVVSLKARAFVGITSRTMQKIQRDVAQRYVVIPVTPFNQMEEGFKRRALGEIFQEIRENRDNLMSELMDYLNKILVKLGEEPGLAKYNTDLRMADYGKMLALVCEIEGVSFALAEDFVKKMQAYTMSENDPIFLALRNVAQAHGEAGIFARSKKLYELCKQYAPNADFSKKYKNSVVFAKSLRAYANGGQMPHYGISIQATMSGNSYKYRLVRLVGVKGLDEMFTEQEEEDDD